MPGMAQISCRPLQARGGKGIIAQPLPGQLAAARQKIKTEFGFQLAVRYCWSSSCTTSAKEKI